MDGFWQIITNGFSAKGAFLIGLIIALAVYLRFLSATRLKPTPPESPEDTVLSEAELDRYARHIVLREIGGAGQMRLRKARVLVIGAGGLSAPILSYLTGAGVGLIGIIDDDVVEVSNLQRQVLFDETHLNKPKVFAAQMRLNLLNPYVKIAPYHRRFDADIAADLIKDFDLIIDGSDNFATRWLVNKTCWRVKKPFIFGAIGQWDGQVSLFNPNADNPPCYACVFPIEPTRDQMPSCAESGVMGALPAIIGAMMASEAIKWITGAGAVLQGHLMIYDALGAESRKIKISRAKNCAVCGKPAQKPTKAQIKAPPKAQIKAQSKA